MDYKATGHSYYCTAGSGLLEYDTWQEFKSEWWDTDQEPFDDDLNCLFRFDFQERRDPDTGEPIGGLELELFFMQQRKGNFQPVSVKSIAPEDMEEIESFLRGRWEYMTKLWVEFSGLRG